MARSFRHIQRIRVRLASGDTVEYLYHRLSKRRLYNAPGTAAFEAEYDLANKGYELDLSPLGPKAVRIRPRPCYVYFVLAKGLERIKIGKSVRPRVRLAALQIGCPVPLELMGVIYDHSGGRVETSLHAQFASVHIHGEWFGASKELLTYIRGLIADRVVRL